MVIDSLVGVDSNTNDDVNIHKQPSTKVRADPVLASEGHRVHKPKMITFYPIPMIIENLTLLEIERNINADPTRATRRL